MGEVRVEEHGDGVILATIANPPHALMDEEIVLGLEGLAERAESDPDLTAVVLTGAHPERFVAHYDVAELLDGARQSPSVAPAVARASLGAVSALRRLPGGREALERTPAAGLSAVARSSSASTPAGPSSSPRSTARRWAAAASSRSPATSD
jgi:hypothetical protein